MADRPARAPNPRPHPGSQGFGFAGAAAVLESVPIAGLAATVFSVKRASLWSIRFAIFGVPPNAFDDALTRLEDGFKNGPHTRERWDLSVPGVGLWGVSFSMGGILRPPARGVDNLPGVTATGSNWGQAGRAG